MGFGRAPRAHVRPGGGVRRSVHGRRDGVARDGRIDSRAPGQDDPMSQTAADPRHELARDLKPADYRRLARAACGAGELPGTMPLRLAVLSSFTAEFLEPYLVVEGLRRGFIESVHFGAFGQFEQEL